MGLSAVQGAVIAGAADVVAIDTNDFKLDKAREFGATLTLNPARDRSPNPNRDETAEKVMEYTRLGRRRQSYLVGGLRYPHAYRRSLQRGPPRW